MIRIYVAVEYIEETETGFAARYVAGYTRNEYYARLFLLDSNSNDLKIDVFEGETYSELEEYCLEIYGYRLFSDVLDEIQLFRINDGREVVTTLNTIYNSMAELDTYSEAVSSFVESFFVLQNLFHYMKDDMFESLFKHIFTSYIERAVDWLYDGTGELDDSPIDIVQGLVNLGYFPTIDEIGDNET